MNLFGKRRPTGAEPVVSGGGGGGGNQTTAAIGKLRDQIETLEKREDHLQRKIDGELKQVREFSKQNKKREALTCLKRKKMYEQQLNQIANAKFTLDTQKINLEAMQLNKETLEAQRTAANAMQSAVRQIGGVDAVEETMDQLEEANQDAQEIGEAVSRQIGTGLDLDEDDLLAELEALETDDLTESLTNVSGLGAPIAQATPQSAEQAELEALNTMMNFPSAPTSTPAAQMTEEERELAELEASMAAGS